MKGILLALAIFTISCAYSQEKKSKEERQVELESKKAYAKYDPRDSLDYPVKHCLILATSKFLSNKVDITIDYGQDSGYFEDTKIRDSNGKVMNFNSVMDALNYMSSIGWKFIDAYSITIGNHNVYHFLMESKEHNEKDFIPKTKRDFKKR